MCRWWRRRGGGADGSEAHDGGRDGGSAGDRRRCMYDGTYGGILQDRSSIGEKTRVTDSPRITSGKRFSASHFIRRLEDFTFLPSTIPTSSPNVVYFCSPKSLTHTWTFYFSFIHFIFSTKVVYKCSTYIRNKSSYFFSTVRLLRLPPMAILSGFIVLSS